MIHTNSIRVGASISTFGDRATSRFPEQSACDGILDTFVPDYNRYPKDKPGIMGGWDAPMFYNGRVMTRREYAQLYGG